MEKFYQPAIPISVSGYKLAALEIAKRRKKGARNESFGSWGNWTDR
jgi:hypothetical protein